MRYFELLGLPGSGKTTLLRSFRGRSFAGQAGKTVLSEDWAMAMRRFGYRDNGFLSGLKLRGPGVPRPEVFSNHILDCWQMGVLAEYPELFSQIFLCLETVDSEDRQREILLNYWRSRTSVYLEVSKSSSRSFCVVDEGLSQSVFSTMTRMSAPSNRKLGLVNSVLRSLPSGHTVIMLRTPLETIEMRAQSGQVGPPEDLSRKGDELDYILQQQKDYGRDAIELDGSLSVHELCLELGAQIKRRITG